jgi:ABC-type enterochelin transport system permease subunit
MIVMSKNEVTIKSQPFKEIVIMEQTHFSTPDDIARFTSVIAGGKLAGLYWAEGVVFLYFPLPPSNAAVARMLIESGKVYWTFVGYALMPKYLSTIETKEKMIVPVIDISSNAMLRKVTQWLKEQK